MGKSHSKHGYSIPLSKPEETVGESPTYRHANFVKGLLTKITRLPEVEDLQQLYLTAFKLYSSRPCLGTRIINKDGTRGEYRFKEYFEIKALCDRIGSGLINLGLITEAPGAVEGETFKFVGIYAKNREEWVIGDLACVLYGITTLPFYDTLGHEAVKFVFDQTGVATVMASGEHVANLVKGVKNGEFNSLKNIVCFDEITKEQQDAADAAQVRLISWGGVIEAGKAFVQYTKATPDSVFTFCYTSGTTSLPKAAMLTHKSSLAMVASLEESDFLSYEKVNEKDVYISYLPLAHVFERNMMPVFLSRGASIGFFSGDVMKLKEDLKALRPTIFLSVPRLYSRFYDGIKQEIDKLQGMKKKLAQKAVKDKLEALKKGEYKHLIYDGIVFKKMREILGGRVKLLASGSAPLASDVADFLKVCFSCPLLEGYGATETCSGIFCQHPDDAIAGHVGGPIGSCEFKVVDIPDMNYTSKDKGPDGKPLPRGEICVRGPFLFKGYYKDPEKTAEAIDKDGWLHTGDVGQISTEGALKIIDRKKNLFKLSQGEYISPEKIENVYMTCKYVAEVFLYGDSFQSFCVVIMVPNKKPLMELATELGITGEFEDVCKDKKLAEKVLEEMNKIGKGAKLNGLELAKKIYLEPKSFVLQNLATPTLKLMRAPAKKQYNEIINSMYAS